MTREQLKEKIAEQRPAPHQRDAAIAETDGPQTTIRPNVADGDQPPRIPDPSDPDEAHVKIGKP